MSCKTLLKAFVLAVSTFVSIVSHSQDKVISGKVTDSKDVFGMSGVNITAKGATTGTLSGPGGVFQISVGSSVNTLVFSFVNYGTQEIDITGKTSVNVSMALANNPLSEVVVI